ncbi:MAG: hypothetical protein ACLR7N_12255 [Roseburia hominis]
MEGPTRAVDGQFADAAEIMYTPEDYRFTVNGGCIYAICMRCPRDGRFLIRSFAKSTNQNLPGVSRNSACGYAARLCGAGCVARRPGRSFT